MNMTEKAIVMAVACHGGQKRKLGGGDYIWHPLECGKICSEMTSEDKIVAAAVLHDTIEDGGLTKENIQEKFDYSVAYLVDCVSEVKNKDWSWKERKTDFIKKLKFAPYQAALIVLGDKLSSLKSMYNEYLVYGDEVFNSFNEKDKNEQKWYFNEIKNILHNAVNVMLSVDDSELDKRKIEEYYNMYVHLFNEIFE
jgi:myo-inositol-1(or 4)-monophosphatase